MNERNESVIICLTHLGMAVANPLQYILQHRIDAMLLRIYSERVVDVDSEADTTLDRSF